MYQVILKPRAIRMALDVYKWYEKQQIGLGDSFLLELENCYDKMESWPLSYAIVRENYRQIIVKRFPYVVTFRIVGKDILVYAIFHTSRNPQKKFK